MKTTVIRTLAAAGLASSFAVGTGSAPVLAGGQERLTVARAVAEALAHNDRLVNQDDALEVANLAVRHARSIYQPKVVPNIQGSFGQTNVSNQSYRLDLSQRFTTGTELRLGLGTSTSQIPSGPDGESAQDVRFYNADTTLTVSQPLLRGFGQAVARRPLTTAETNLRDAARQKTLAEQQVTVEVAGAYYRLVTQEALIRAADASLDRARQLLAAAEAKLEAGLVSQLDVLRATNLVSQTEMQLLDAQAGAEDARDYLTFLIGRAPGDPFEVTSDIPRTIDDIQADDAVATALSRRLDLQSAVAAAEEAERTIAYARNQLLPQLDVSMALTRRQTARSFLKSFGVDRFQTATFFTISMPVDRTPQQVEYQNAVLSQARRQRDLETLRRRVANDVRRAIRNRDRVVRTLEAAEASVAISRQEVDVARLRSERGLSDNLAVVTAEAGLLAMETRRLSALADLAVARLALRATIGILDPRADVETPPEGAAGQDRRQP